MAKETPASPKEIVRANNELFRAQSKTTNVLEGRIFMAFASLVDPNNVRENGNFVECKIPASAVIEVNAGGNYYKRIKDAAYNLLDKKIERRFGENGFKVYTLFSTIGYNEGIITAEFHKDLAPFFEFLNGNFTQLYLAEYMKMSNSYGQRLFCYLKSWDDKPEVTVELQKLHGILGTTESLQKNFAEFRRRVLDKCHKDICENTSLYFEWEGIKKGRSFVSVRFIFSKKRATAMLESSEETPKVAKQRTKKQVATTTDEEKRTKGDFFPLAMQCFKAQGKKACEGGLEQEEVCDICKVTLQKKFQS